MNSLLPDTRNLEVRVYANILHALHNEPMTKLGILRCQEILSTMHLTARQQSRVKRAVWTAANKSEGAKRKEVLTFWSVEGPCQVVCEADAWEPSAYDDEVAKQADKGGK